MERHIGVLYTGSGIPTEQVLYDTGQLKLQRDNIWFFSPNSTGVVNSPNACTFENPCNSTQFTAGNVNAINTIAPYTNFYLADGGSYLVGPLLTLNPGQSIYGRTADFCQVAPGSPVILGGITVLGGNTLQAFRLIADGNVSTGITAINAPNITIDRVKIGPSLSMVPFSEIPTGSFAYGIVLNNSKATITDSIINAGDINHNAETAARGLYAYNGSAFSIANSAINVHSSGFSSLIAAPYFSTMSRATGLRVVNSQGDIANNIVTVTGDGLLTNTDTMYVRTRGLAVLSDSGFESKVNSRNNQVNTIAYSQQSTGTGGVVRTSTAGIYDGSQDKNSKSIVNSTNDQFSISANAVNNVSSGQAIAFYTVGAGAVCIADHTYGEAQLNTNGDRININANAKAVDNNARIPVLLGIIGVVNGNNGISKVNSAYDSVTIKANATTSGSATIGNYVEGSLVALVNPPAGTSIVNAKGDIFKAQLTANGDPNPLNTYIRTNGVVALAQQPGGFALVNITGGNQFIFQSRVNNAPSPVSYKTVSGTGTSIINDDGTNRFLAY